MLGKYALAQTVLQMLGKYALAQTLLQSRYMYKDYHRFEHDAI
jgi:hypothetical protein